MPHETLQYKGEPILECFLDYLDMSYGGNIYKQIKKDGKIKDYIKVIINNQSILSLPQGIRSPIKNGDTIIITIMLDGG